MTRIVGEKLNMKNPHNSSISTVLEYTGSDVKLGISEQVASQRLVDGKNKIITPQPSVWKLYLAPLFDTLIVVYLIMTAIMFVLSIFVEGIAGKVTFWLVLISFNMILAIFQQVRAQKKLNSLQDLSPPMSVVLRDGRSTEIKSENLVPGDILLLTMGDKVPADARILESSTLSMNEASLTGESDPVSKFADGSDEIPLDTPLAKRKNMVYLGTFVQVGEAKVVVVNTGNDTELGIIASSMGEMQTMEMPLRTKINFLGKVLSTLMISFLIVFIIFTGIKRSKSGDQFTFDRFAFDLAQGIINAMAVMPINIPLLTTVVLVTGVINMAKSKVVIKDLTAVETLGRVSVLCSDKTGTMTTSMMTSKLVYDTQVYYAITGNNDMEGKITRIAERDIEKFMLTQWVHDEKNTEIDSSSTLGLLLTSVVLNNNATINRKIELDGHRQIGWECHGNPTDAALLILAKTNGFQEKYLRYRYKKRHSYPFNSSVKRMSGIFQDEEEGDMMLFVKGATSVILPLCTNTGDESVDIEFTEPMKKEIIEKVNKFADQGYRVISVAYRSIDSMKKYRDDDIEKERSNLEQYLTYVGFVVIYDPPRMGVADAVNDLDSAGIFPIMITGDSPNTAATIARQVGVLDEDELVVAGKDIPNLSDEDFFRTSVFARVSPQDKEIIVSKYQTRGDVIAMAGDGVNDALAITRADAGVAMGKTGTEITKEAADIIITDDSYVSMVKGVEEGRNLFEKIRMMVYFYIAVNLAEALVYFTTAFNLDFAILNNWQRVYIFAIIHALPPFALIFGPPDKNIMKLKPRASSDILSKKLVITLVLYAVSLASSILLIYFLYYNGVWSLNSTNMGGILDMIQYRDTNSLDPENVLLPEHYAQVKARTMLLSIIYIAESSLILSIRRINSNILNGNRDMNKMIAFFIFAGPLLHFLLMYITPLQRGLNNFGINIELMRLDFVDLLIIFFFGLLPTMIIEGYKYRYRKMELQF